MSRTTKILLASGLLGVACALVYTRADRANEPAAAAQPQKSDEHAELQASPVPPQPTADTQAYSAPAASLAPQPSAELVERWVAGIDSHDPRARTAAIAALSKAPKATAMRALQRVLQSGEAQVDRQIALQSLHTIALEQGDDDGAVRDVMRRALYHGDDEGVSQSAQALIEDIEAEYAQRAQDAQRPAR